MIPPLGCAPCLGATLLTRWFTHTPEGQASCATVVHDTPSALTRMLAAGDIAALVPSFECFRVPAGILAPGISLSAQDALESVRAFSRLPWRMTQSVATPDAPTASALLKIVLAEQFDAHPAFISGPSDPAVMIRVADAALLTDDQALRFEGQELNALDLGRAWRRMTRLPFVLAVWLGRPEFLTQSLIQILHAARNWGLSQIDPVARELAETSGGSAELYRRYLTDTLDYNLGEEHRRSLDAFGALAYAHGLMPHPPGPLHVL